MWAKMSKAGFFLLSLSLFPLLVLLIMAPTTRLDLLTVLIFDLLPLPFIAIGGLLLEKRDPYPFVVSSIFIPFLSLLIATTSGATQIIGIILTSSMLINIFTYELGHEISYRIMYYTTVLLITALGWYQLKVFVVLLGGTIAMCLVTTKLSIQVEAVIFNGLFAITICELNGLHSTSCLVSLIVAAVYLGLAVTIAQKASTEVEKNTGAR